MKRERHYRLTDNQERVLAAGSLSARGAIRDCARLAGVKETTARDTLSSLLANRIIEPFTLVNIHALGYLDYCLFFSLEGKNQRTRALLLEYLKSCNQVVYAAELAGDYQYTVSFVSAALSEVDIFLRELARRANARILKKTISLRSDWYYLGYRLADIEPRPPLHRSAEARPVELKYPEVLRAVVNEPLLSYTDLSSRLKLPISTTRAQVQQLERTGVILGYPLLVNYSRLGLQTFRLLITENHSDRSLQRKLLAFCSRREEVIDFVRTLGNWDYEINLSVQRAEDIPEFVADLLSPFKRSIESVQVHALLEIHKLKAIPPERP